MPRRPTPPAAEPPRAAVFGQVFLVAQHLTRLADQALQPLGLTTSQWLLLAVVTRHPHGPPSVSQAAARYGTSRQNVKQVARQLAARGFLRLLADPADARVLRLHPTPRVAATFDGPDAVREQKRFLARLFEGLADAEVAALDATLGRWLAALAPAERSAR
jgi:DNA-binding MarR family transcriptional regulator